MSVNLERFVTNLHPDTKHPLPDLFIMNRGEPMFGMGFGVMELVHPRLLNSFITEFLHRGHLIDYGLEQLRDMTNRCCSCGMFVAVQEAYYCTDFGGPESLEPGEETIWCKKCFDETGGRDECRFWNWTCPKLNLGLEMPMDIEVIEPDENVDKKLDWKIYEYQGCEILKLEPGRMVKLALEDATEHVEDPNGCYVLKGAVRDIDGLAIGDEVVCPGLMGDWRLAKVAEIDGKEGCAETEVDWFTLEYEDLRGCWISTCQINRQAIDKIRIP